MTSANPAARLPRARRAAGRRRVLLVAGVGLVLVLLSSCTLLRPEGTTFELPGRIRVVAPAGAVAESALLAALPLPEPVDGPHLVPHTAYELRSAAAWRTPLTVTITYPPSLPAGATDHDLRMVRLDPTGWREVPASVVDPSARTVTAKVAEPGRVAVAWSGCDPAAPADCTLREAGARARVRVGATLEAAEAADPAYSATLAREFDALTPENALKMYAVQDERGRWTFDDADRVVDFADAHGMAVRGHTLVWSQDQYTPAWVRAITDPTELRVVTEEHIETVMARYRGRIHRWDVVNEPLASFGTGPSGSVWDDVLGPGWVADAFRHAHAVDPTAELWLNEYGTDWVPGKHEALLALVRDLVDAGVPVQGVGLQTHRPSVQGPDPAVFERQLRDFAALGLKVAVTELDVVTSPADPQALGAQADAYGRVVAACLAVAACEEVTVWGVTDANTWLDGLGLFPTPTRPLLFDASYQPKPAYGRVRDLLAASRAPG